MQKQEINYKLLLLLFTAGAILWFIPHPSGLTDAAWHIFVTFFVTIIGIITLPMPMSAVTMVSLAVLLVTGTLKPSHALAGFASETVWLIILALFIAKGFIKTGLGKRLAYFFISKFGHSTLGLAYSLILTEFVLAPATPSATARGGGIMYPIAQSLAEVYNKAAGKQSKTAAFIIALCFHANVITCALFLTSMAANPVAAKLAHAAGVNLTWTSWALGTIVPGLINLVLLPFVLFYLAPPADKRNHEVPKRAEQALHEMGKMSYHEVVMAIAFVVMITLWIFGAHFRIDATTTALLGFLILIITGVLKWDDAVNEHTAWNTMVWFAILLTMADALAKFGVITWMEGYIKAFIGDSKSMGITLLLVAAFFYVHYFFASVTAHVTVMYTTFLLIFIHLGISPLLAAIALGAFSNLSGGLTHYGINPAPIYFGAGYFSVKEWWKIGAIVTTFNLLIWLIVGKIWWSLLGWM